MRNMRHLARARCPPPLSCGFTTITLVKGPRETWTPYVCGSLISLSGWSQTKIGASHPTCPKENVYLMIEIACIFTSGNSGRGPIQRGGRRALACESCQAWLESRCFLIFGVGTWLLVLVFFLEKRKKCNKIERWPSPEFLSGSHKWWIMAFFHICTFWTWNMYISIH